MDARLRYRSPDTTTLAGYALQHQVDPAAPIQAAAEIVVNAPVDHVWRLLIDVENWADSLEPGLSKVDVSQGVRVGARFTRTNRGFTMTARFEVVSPEREIAWTGTALGVHAIHRFELEPLPDGRTLVRTEESMGGRPLAVLYSSAKLQGLMDASLASFKAACER